MKTARFVLKLVAVGLSIASLACLMVAYWDKIMECFYDVCDKLEGRKCVSPRDAEFEDYADCDI